MNDNARHSSEEVATDPFVPVRGRDLVVGRPVPYSIYDTYDRLLLRSGRILKSDAQRQMLLEAGRTRAASFRDEVVVTGDGSPSWENHSGELKFDPFVSFYHCATSLRKVHHAIDLGRRDFLPRLEGMISQLGNLIDRDADAALAAAHINREFPNLVLHPIRKAVVADLLARSASLDGGQRRAVVGASLTGNLSMLALQEQLDQQEGALSDDQRREIHGHPERSVAVLAAAGLEDQQWLRAVREHHERMDGSGYPQGLTQGQIGTEAAVVMLADVYMAMVTPRAHRPAHVIRDALRELYEDAGRRFDATLTRLLIRELGIFPPGTLVGLNTGETAVVTRRGPSSMAPQVFLLRRPDGSIFIRPRFRALAEEEGVEIRSVYRQEELRVLYSPHMAWGYDDEWGEAVDRAERG
ncbi:HD-GYP domain-containing protein [Halorhodospira halophila]|uniref:Putative metal dependent phosphohydrolase n=1 Tax=Halorhodospira halophila (strain DSM 244 / SL1) TaxID=349124 RepID=A1WU05_HALHL|nr:HD domain-containing phosphohydrolase [Halorhodospira halophila]ABM61167.1 putative metal dependent phosphohydrolase [Halorhodospira halophila SL1]MBK1729640.1 hypothetical protein [Halorhodospira halophila]